MLVIDKEMKMGHSLVQHGKLNDRIYIMDYKHTLDPYIINQVQLLVKSKDYGKVIAKIPKGARHKFIRNGYIIEADIPNYYSGKEDCLFVAKYYKKSRTYKKKKDHIRGILKSLEDYEPSQLESLDDDFELRILETKHINDMVGIYKVVFETYPFPIHDPRFLEKTMEESTLYFGIFYRNELIGLSSCEMNLKEKNVEMTDFAILPEYRGNQLARQLLLKMETEMRGRGIMTAYTIARSISFPMNATFAATNYDYSGTLWNNTQIAGEIESMNIWHKNLGEL